MGKLRLWRFGGNCWRLCSCVLGSEMAAPTPRSRSDSLHLFLGLGSDSQISSDCGASTGQGFTFKTGSRDLKLYLFGTWEWDRSTCPNTSFLTCLNGTWKSHWEVLAESPLPQALASCQERRGQENSAIWGQISPVGKVIVITIGWAERKHKWAWKCT